LFSEPWKSNNDTQK